MAAKDLELRCPDCGARLRVDPRTGQVVAHARGDKPRDLDEAARQHAERGSGKDAAFQAAVDAERGRKQELDDLFRKAAEKARQDEDDTGKPPERSFDDRWR